MGLDITAYSGLKKLDVLFDADDEPVDKQTQQPIGNYLRVYTNDDFPGRAEGLEDLAVYSYEAARECFGMGYGGYNRWRNELAKLAGYPLTEYTRANGTNYSHAAACWQGAQGPFSELINFADNEGVIGPIVSAKLLRDFIDWDQRAKDNGDPSFYDVYSRLREGLELAADGGCLDFH